MMKDDHPIAKAVVPILQGICHHRTVFEDAEHNGKFKLNVFADSCDYPLLRGTKNETLLATVALVTEAGRRLGIVAEYSLECRGQERTYKQFPFVEAEDFDNQEFVRLFEPLCKLVGIEPRGVYPFYSNGKLRVYVPIEPGQEVILHALNILFFCWGYTNGRKISIKPDQR
jgi:hypothetical protein